MPGICISTLLRPYALTDFHNLPPSRLIISFTRVVSRWCALLLGHLSSSLKLSSIFFLLLCFYLLIRPCWDCFCDLSPFLFCCCLYLIMEILSFFLVSFITALMCVFILLETRNVQRMYVLCKFNIWVHCLLSTFPPFNGRRNGPSESSSVTLCLLKLTKPSPSLHTDPHHSLASTDGIPLSVPATCSSSRD